MSADAIVMLSTASSEEEAKTIASALVEGHLAACVNIVPGVRSIYFWEGKVQDEREWLCVIKTRAQRQEQVTETIQRLHSYTCPEAIALPVVAGSEAYLEWLHQVTE